MPIQLKKHEVTVGMIASIDDFYTRCQISGMTPAVTTRKCMEKFGIRKAYVGQAIKIRSYLKPDNQELCNLLDNQKISADTCLTIIQCFNANFDANKEANKNKFSDLNSLVSEILQDENIKRKIGRGRLSKGCFVKWRDERGLKFGKLSHQQGVRTTIDDNGRITIPDEYLKVLGLQYGDGVTLRLKSGGVHILIPQCDCSTYSNLCI